MRCVGYDHRFIRHVEQSCAALKKDETPKKPTTVSMEASATAISGDPSRTKATSIDVRNLNTPTMHAETFNPDRTTTPVTGPIDTGPPRRASRLIIKPSTRVLRSAKIARRPVSAMESAEYTLSSASVTLGVAPSPKSTTPLLSFASPLTSRVCPPSEGSALLSAPVVTPRLQRSHNLLQDNSSLHPSRSPSSSTPPMECASSVSSDRETGMKSSQTAVSSLRALWTNPSDEERIVVWGSDAEEGSSSHESDLEYP